MARTYKLDPQQQIALDEVSAADTALREAKMTVEAEVRLTVEKRLASLEAVRDAAVRRAFDLGVAKAKIGLVGLHTKHPRAADEILSRTVIEVETTSRPSSMFSWFNRENQMVRLHVIDFDTTSQDRSYPRVLEGIVKRDHNAPGGWSVEKDQTAVETARGTIPGHISWELERFDTGDKPKLAALLDEWEAVN